MKYLMQYQAWIPNKVRGIMNTSLYKKRNLMLFLFFSMIFQGINMKLKQVPRTKLETLIGSGVFPHIHSLFISNCQMDPQVLIEFC